MPYAAASAGTADGDFDRLCEILNNIEGVNFICLDVANGYSQFFVQFVEKVRKTFPSHTIMVSFDVYLHSIGFKIWERFNPFYADEYILYFIYFAYYARLEMLLLVIW